MADSSKTRKKPHYTGVNRKVPVIEHEAIDHDSKQQTQKPADPIKMEKQSKKSEESEECVYTSGVSWIRLLLSGVMGGLITLSLWIGIQWASFLPSFVTSDRVAGEQALQMVESYKKQFEETIERYERDLQMLREKVSHVTKELNTLKTTFDSFASQHLNPFQEDKVSQEENKQAFTVLEDKVSVLEKQVQNLVRMTQDMKSDFLVGQSNQNDLVALKKQLDNMREKIDTKSAEKNETNTAMFIAIIALKNAVDRGGSYVNELEIVQQFLPLAEGLDLLQKTASTGLPSSAKLSADFADVADAIVRTQSMVASKDDFSEQIWAWIKGLVVSRPVGNVEGTTVGAIAARMEVAIQVGDYEKALAEWQTLPQSAKDVSADFIHKLERSLAVHRVLQKLLVFVQQEASKVTKM
ncbi:COG4223 family protein [Bartonella sp. A05]|uniref:COG4223 family protein n=1 Tax=Bartonella sp. A05 TaxID=2967261 RepID=UPI0022A8D68C|nr:hypothetical protein [Bartonella sp. A05]MCZ2203568.1 hypothetical protein [Bartonella sp. A05]